MSGQGYILGLLMLALAIFWCKKFANEVDTDVDIAKTVDAGFT